MSIINRLLGRRKKFRKELTESSSSKNQLAKFAVKAVSFIKGDSSGDGREEPEFDLEEIKEAHENDSYIQMSYLKYSQMFLKAGYKIKSENEKASEYVKLRFYVMSFSTNKPTDLLFQEIGDDIIRYSNAFIVKSRVKQIMNGVQAKGFLSNQPVGGYFRVDPATMFIDRDSSGTIKKYIQEVDGKEKSFNPTEVIHFYLNKDAASAYGTPRVLAAIEDVKLLRRIEGSTAAMIHRYALPLYQWKIGLPQAGYQASQNDIDKAVEQVDNMSFDGTIVTNEKTAINVVGAQGNALSTNDYLKYFEERVFSALDLSATQMGRSSNQNADAMEAQTHNNIKHIQKTFSIFVENFMINELLFEGGFDPINKVEDRVTFEFNEVSLDTKIKLENHELAKYQSNIITLQEMRREVGRHEEVDEANLYKNIIEVNAEREIAKIRSEESIRVAQENAKLNPAQQTGSGQGGNGLSPKGNGTTKDQKPNNDVTNKNTPANQYGQTSVKIKESFSAIETQRSKDLRTFKSIFKIYNNLAEDVSNGEDFDKIESLYLEEFISAINNDINKANKEGVYSCIKDAGKPISVKVDTSIVSKKAEKDLRNLMKDIAKKLKSSDKPRAVFEAFEYRLRFIVRFNIPSAKWYAYAVTAKELGLEYIYIDFDGSKDEEEHKGKVKLSELTIHDLPPFHPYCNCKIKLKED